MADEFSTAFSTAFAVGEDTPVDPCPPTYIKCGLPGGASDPDTAPTWADPYTIALAAAGVLRINPNHEDFDRLQASAESAIREVDRYLDRADDPIVSPTPRPIIDASVQVTIEMYRRKDAPFGVLNSWSDTDMGPVRIGTDPMKGVEQMLMPYAHRYGVN